MGKVHIESEKLKEILSRGKASRASEERAARALMDEDERGILEIADYVSKVIRVLRNIPAYQALPSSNYRDSGRWKMYERLYRFCDSWEINPKIWIDAQTDFMINQVSAANDEVFISQITSVREGTMEIFDEYCAENAFMIRVQGAYYEYRLLPDKRQIERNRVYELAVNLMSGRISDNDILRKWEPELREWNKKVRDYLRGNGRPVIEKNGIEWAKFVYYRMYSVDELNVTLIPWIPCGRIWANPRDKGMVLRLTHYYATRPDLCEKLYEIWRGQEAEYHIPGRLFGCLKKSEALVKRFGARGIDMNTEYELPSVPYNDAELEMKGASGDGDGNE